MPNFRPQDLRQLGYDLFEKCGCSAEDACTVTDHLVDSSLYGHDSHGTIRYYEYVNQIREGRFNPRGTPQIVQEKACTAVVDGGGALGQVGAAFAARLAMSKAREKGVGVVALRNTAHVGRAGAYPLMAAREGLLGLAFVNAGKLGRQIAPYGGLDGKLSTNPIAFAAPRRNADPVMVDMTTSVVAEGKVRVYQNRGHQLPEGWIIDHQGQPATDPRAYTGKPPGAILPLGGVVGYKGYCLSFVVEILGGALSGEGCAAGERIMHSNGVLLTVYDLEQFTDLDSYYDELEILIGHVHTSRIDPRVGEILVPGEPEFRSARRREVEGIPVDDTTWSRICEAAKSVGLDPAPWEKLQLS
ncbi:MAG: Ldh family oxidoreductase [Candidatus Latescibacteria bacterium]|nr:Ldh family oxidoreductase [Candidatus Latescibacterota bacterium]